MTEYPIELEPLGGDYAGRYWPLNADQLDEIETTLGWSLPEDYRTFVAAYGLSRGTDYHRVRRDDGKDEPELWVFHGDAGAYSVVENAGNRVDRQELQFAHSDTGIFCLRADGSVFFENTWDRDRDGVVASSFTDFLDRLYLPEE